MTSPQDAPGDTGVERAWAEHSSIIGLARLDKVNGGLDAIGFLRETDRAKAIVEAAVRAQVDEDVRRLVDVLLRYMTYIETFGYERLRDQFGEPAAEGSSWAMEEWLDRVLREPARAALEPFKTVSPTGSEEVNGNG